MRKMLVVLLTALALAFASGAFSLYVWPGAQHETRTKEIWVRTPDPCSVWWDRIASAQTERAVFSLTYQAIRAGC